MSNHLSQDQMSRWILGQCSPEETEHGRHCPTCSAELIRFRENVSTFQNVMKNWSEREIVPRFLETPGVLSRPHWLQAPSLRWGLLGMAVVLLVFLPIYKQQAPEPGLESVTISRTETKANEDVLLMEEVTMHLSRPLPMPMERVMALLPSEDASVVERRNAPEREEVR